MNYQDIERRRQELRKHHAEMFQVMFWTFISCAVIWMIAVIICAVIFLNK